MRLDDAPVAVGSVEPPFPLPTGDAFTLWVDYDAATNRLSAAMGRGAKPPIPLLDLAEDLTRLGPTMWLGFTAATGNASVHRILALTVDVR